MAALCPDLSYCFGGDFWSTTWLGLSLLADSLYCANVYWWFTMFGWRNECDYGIHCSLAGKLFQLFEKLVNSA